MQTSTDRILTTHVGSLPRSKAVTDVVFAQEKGEDPQNAGAIIREAVDDVVAKQVAHGVDIVSDGEIRYHFPFSAITEESIYHNCTDQTKAPLGTLSSTPN